MFNYALFFMPSKLFSKNADISNDNYPTHMIENVVFFVPGSNPVCERSAHGHKATGTLPPLQSI
jgi:hypothetical protein